MQAGTVVRLKQTYLTNPPGTKGVVFYTDGNILRIIFENGKHYIFRDIYKPRLSFRGLTEAEYFLEKIGIEPSLIDYEFHNMVQLEKDFHRGLFDTAFKLAGTNLKNYE